MLPSPCRGGAQLFRALVRSVIFAAALRENRRTPIHRGGGCHNANSAISATFGTHSVDVRNGSAGTAHSSLRKFAAADLCLDTLAVTAYSQSRGHPEVKKCRGRAWMRNQSWQNHVKVVLLANSALRSWFSLRSLCCATEVERQVQILLSL